MHHIENLLVNQISFVMKKIELNKTWKPFLKYLIYGGGILFFGACEQFQK